MALVSHTHDGCVERNSRCQGTQPKPKLLLFQTVTKFVRLAVVQPVHPHKSVTCYIFQGNRDPTELCCMTGKNLLWYLEVILLSLPGSESRNSKEKRTLTSRGSGGLRRLSDIIFSSRLNQDYQILEVYGSMRASGKTGYDSGPSSFPTAMFHVAKKAPLWDLDTMVTRKGY